MVWVFVGRLQRGIILGRRTGLKGLVVGNRLFDVAGVRGELGDDLPESGMVVDLVVGWAFVAALVGHVEGIRERFLDVVISMLYNIRRDCV